MFLIILITLIFEGCEECTSYSYVLKHSASALSLSMGTSNWYIAPIANVFISIIQYAGFNIMTGTDFPIYKIAMMIQDCFIIPIIIGTGAYTLEHN